MKSRFLLNVIIAHSSSIFKTFSCKYKALLVSWNSFFISDLIFDSLNRIRWLYFYSDAPSTQGLNEDLHGTTTESEDEMKGWLFLDVVVAEGSAVFELLSSENEALLITRDTFSVL